MSPAIDSLAALPHRPPFRFVTRVIELAPSQSGIGEWAVTGDEDFFRGHFPGRPIVPGVLIAEALAQIAGVVGFSARTPPALPVDGRLVHVDIRFDGSVIPPATVILHAMLSRQLGPLTQFEVRATVANAVVARGSLTLAELRPPDEAHRKTT